MLNRPRSAADSDRRPLTMSDSANAQAVNYRNNDEMEDLEVDADLDIDCAVPGILVSLASKKGGHPGKAFLQEALQRKQICDKDSFYNEQLDSGYGQSISSEHSFFDQEGLDRFSNLNISCAAEDTVHARPNVNTVENKQNNVSSEIRRIYSPDEDGDSWLHLSIIESEERTILYFISRAPSPDYLNISNNLLQTPLHLAVIMRLPQIVRALILGGADVTAADKRGDTPLHIASREGYTEVAMWLMRSIDGLEESFNSYITPKQSIPQNLETMNYDGQTCFLLAAERNNLDVMRLLLKNGANINAHDAKSGKTVLHYAAESNNVILLDFLLQYRPLDVNVKSYCGMTPLMLAQGRGHRGIVLKLYQAGAEFQTSVIDGDSDSDDDMDDL